MTLNLKKLFNFNNLFNINIGTEIGYLYEVDNNIFSMRNTDFNEIDFGIPSEHKNFDAIGTISRDHHCRGVNGFRWCAHNCSPVLSAKR